MGAHKENDNHKPAKLFRATSQISECGEKYENAGSGTALLDQTEDVTGRSKTETESENDEHSSQSLKTGPTNDQNIDETRVNMSDGTDGDTKEDGPDADKSASKRNQKSSPSIFSRVGFNCCLVMAISVSCSGLTAIIYMHFNPLNQFQSLPDNDFPETSASRYTSTGTMTFAQFIIDQLTLRDERTIVWKNGENLNSSDAFVAGDNGCVLVKRPGVYVLVSKVTFVYKKISPIASLFHAVILKKMNGKRDVLENNSLQLAEKVYRPTRVTQASTITSLQTIQAGDAICIGVTDAKWLYISSSANTLKLFRLSG